MGIEFREWANSSVTMHNTNVPSVLIDGFIRTKEGPSYGRSLLRVTDYDREWAKEVGLVVRPGEGLFRIENAFTTVDKNGAIWNASIVKISKAGSLYTTEGDEGEGTLRWSKAMPSSLTLINVGRDEYRGLTRPLLEIE